MTNHVAVLTDSYSNHDINLTLNEQLPKLATLKLVLKMGAVLIILMIVVQATWMTCQCVVVWYMVRDVIGLLLIFDHTFFRCDVTSLAEKHKTEICFHSYTYNWLNRDTSTSTLLIICVNVHYVSLHTTSLTNHFCLVYQGIIFFPCRNTNHPYSWRSSCSRAK